MSSQAKRELDEEKEARVADRGGFERAQQEAAQALEAARKRIAELNTRVATAEVATAAARFITKPESPKDGPPAKPARFASVGAEVVQDEGLVEQSRLRHNEALAAERAAKALLEKGVLRIHLVGASHLRSGGHLRTVPDTFAKLHLGAERDRLTFKTRTARGTHSPGWDEKFDFHAGTLQEVAEVPLEIAVFDHESVNSSELGRASVDLSALKTAPSLARSATLSDGQGTLQLHASWAPSRALYVTDMHVRRKGLLGKSAQFYEHHVTLSVAQSSDSGGTGSGWSVYRVSYTDDNGVPQASTVIGTTAESKLKFELSISTLEDGLWSMRFHTLDAYEKWLAVIQRVTPPPLSPKSRTQSFGSRRSLLSLSLSLSRSSSKSSS